MTQERIGVGLHNENIQGLNKAFGTHATATVQESIARRQDFEGEAANNFFGGEEGQKESHKIQSDLYANSPTQ